MRNLVLLAVLALSACSSTDTAQPPATSTTTTTTSAKKSAFCLDLDLFNAAVVSYSAKVGIAIEGKPIDFAEARRLAGLVADFGQGMRESAPPEVAEAFQTTLDAVSTSVSKLAPESRPFDVVDPVYNERAQAARKALEEYRC